MVKYKIILDNDGAQGLSRRKLLLSSAAGLISLFISGDDAHALTNETWNRLINGIQHDLLKIVRSYSSKVSRDPSNAKSRLILGIAYHNLARLGYEDYSDRAFEHLERAYQLSPNSNVTLAYLGSAETLQARDSWNPLTKLGKANTGIQKIDLRYNKHLKV